MTAEELAKWLVEWCAEHGQIESAFLYPEPDHYVFTFSLFDDLAKKLGVDKERLGEWFNAAQERREATKKLADAAANERLTAREKLGEWKAPPHKKT